MARLASGRNHIRALLDVDYGVCVHTLHARLFRRFRAAITAATFFAATSAFTAAIASNPFAVQIIGLLLAGLAALDWALDLPQRTAEHLAQRKLYLDLRGRASGLALADIDRELAALEKDDPTNAWSSVDLVAYTRNLQSHGYPRSSVPPLTFLARLVSLVV
jgi:hypothetical protein